MAPRRVKRGPWRGERGGSRQSVVTLRLQESSGGDWDYGDSRKDRDEFQRIQRINSIGTDHENGAKGKRATCLLLKQVGEFVMLFIHQEKPWERICWI